MRSSCWRLPHRLAAKMCSGGEPALHCGRCFSGWSKEGCGATVPFKELLEHQVACAEHSSLIPQPSLAAGLRCSILEWPAGTTLSCCLQLPDHGILCMLCASSHTSCAVLLAAVPARL